VALNALGVVVGAAYFNNLVALEGAMCHSGDSRDGAAEGDDEVIDLDLDRLPSQGVCSVALCVFAYKDGSLSNVRGITSVLRVKDKGGQWFDAVKVPVADIVSGRSTSVTGILVAGIYSPDKGKTWSVQRLGHPLEGPRDFQAGSDDVRDACFAANIIKGAFCGQGSDGEHRVSDAQAQAARICR
jgi:stress response protein SCP2